MDGEKIKAGFNNIGNGIMPASKVLTGNQTGWKNIQFFPASEIEKARLLRRERKQAILNNRVPQR